MRLERAFFCHAPVVLVWLLAMADEIRREPVLPDLAEDLLDSVRARV